MDNSLLSARWIFLMLHALLCVFCFFLVCKFSPVYHATYKRLREFYVDDGSDWNARTRCMRSSFQAGHGIGSGVGKTSIADLGCLLRCGGR